MKEINLTQGFSTIVDDQDYDWLTTNYSWCYNNGYAETKIGDKTVRMHQLIVSIITGSWPDLVEHEDGNGLNNRRENLLSSNKSRNALNRQPKERGASLTWNGKWRAQLTVKGVRVLDKVFDSKQEAQDCYERTKARYLSVKSL